MSREQLSGCSEYSRLAGALLLLLFFFLLADKRGQMLAGALGTGSRAEVRCFNM